MKPMTRDQLEEEANRLLSAAFDDALPINAPEVIGRSVGYRPLMPIKRYVTPKDTEPGIVCCDCGRPRSRWSAARCIECHRKNACLRYFERVGMRDEMLGASMRQFDGEQERAVFERVDPATCGGGVNEF